MSSHPEAKVAADWLTPTRIRLYCGALLCSSIFVAAAAIALGDPPFDVFRRPIAEDFVAKAIGGRIAAAGRMAELYDVGLQRETQTEILGERDHYAHKLNPFLSPPFVAVFYAPLAVLPYLFAVALWTSFSIALVAGSLAALQPLVPSLSRWGLAPILLVAFSMQPVVELLGDGQDSALSLAILVGGLRLLADGRDLPAGALLGLGVFKPQIFFLVPCLLVCERRWRAVLAWCAVAGLLAMVSIALVGPHGARAYVALLESDLYRLGIGEDLRWKMQSLPALAGALFPPPLRIDGGLLANAALVIAAAAILFVVLRRRRKSGESGATIALPYSFAILLGACVNPHFFLYDCTVLLVPVLILFDAAPDAPRVRLLLLAGYVLLWTAPLRQMLFGGSSWPLSVLAAPWAAVVIAALALCTADRLRAAPAGGRS